MSNGDCCAPFPNESRSSGPRLAGRGPLVEILYFDGCPNHQPAIALVERLSRDLGIEPELRLVNVRDQEAARRLRFLGSPTIRVGGVDVDPRTEERGDYALACRVFRTEAGVVGQPDEQWVRDALMRGAAALEAAAIAPARRGADRTRRLSDRERELYRWILERFAHAAPPSAAGLSGHARGLGLDPAAALASLASEDLVHTDEQGAIVVAYPFSARPRGHRVLIDNVRSVQAMCAVDALGIAPMLNLPIEITSHDPVSGAEIWVRLDPAEGAWWEPQSAVVLAGSNRGDGPAFGGCCNVLNFFEAPETAQQYLHEHEDVAGLPVSIPDAIEIGRAVFGDIFKEP